MNQQTVNFCENHGGSYDCRIETLMILAFQAIYLSRSA